MEHQVITVTSRKKNDPGSWVSTVIGVLSLVVAIIALLPAFASLSKNEPQVQYATVLRTVEGPDPIDKSLFKKFLADNGIPSQTISVQLKNTGKAATKSTKILVSTPGAIVRYGWNPPAKSEPIWVEIQEGQEFGMNSGIREARVEAKNLAPMKLLEFAVGYESDERNLLPQVEVFSDGTAAERLSDISQAQTVPAWELFKLPLIILGVGLLLTALTVFARLVLKSAQYREILINVVESLLRGVIKSVWPFR